MENKVFKLVLTALFAALVCVATLLVRIPVPATGGYANLGDGVILAAAFMIHPLYAALAAGVGSMMADLLAGYMQFAVGTFIIKGLMAVIAGCFFHRMKRERQGKARFFTMVMGAVFAEVWMVMGYFAFEAVFLGFGMGAAASIPGNAGQGIIGMAVGCTVTPILLRNSEVKNMMIKTWK